MKSKVLVADNDMDAHHLLHDILEIVVKHVKIERAMSVGSFWEKISTPSEEAAWSAVFLCVEYVKEAPDEFLARIKAINPELPGKIVLMGQPEDLNACGDDDDDIRQLHFLTKPFSLDHFEKIVNTVTNRPRSSE